jgi:deoxyribodipyrimidine photo-lyase
VLEWSRTPQAALATMIELNNRYALDGRDPTSYSGIAQVLSGRFERAWPERAIYGTVRSLSMCLPPHASFGPRRTYCWAAYAPIR